MIRKNRPRAARYRCQTPRTPPDVTPSPPAGATDTKCQRTAPSGQLTASFSSVTLVQPFSSIPLAPIEEAVQRAANQPNARYRQPLDPIKEQVPVFCNKQSCLLWPEAIVAPGGRLVEGLRGCQPLWNRMCGCIQIALLSSVEQIGDHAQPGTDDQQPCCCQGQSSPT